MLSLLSIPDDWFSDEIPNTSPSALLNRPSSVKSKRSLVNNSTVGDYASGDSYTGGPQRGSGYNNTPSQSYHPYRR